MTAKIRIAATLLALRLCPAAAAATLKPETVAAWDAYLAAAHAAMQARLQPGAQFLWLDEKPDRTEHVRTQGPYILPVGTHIPRKVAFGLIHDWLGAGFIPNVTIEDILHVVRDYDRYKDIYHPGVIDSISHGTDGVKDLFSMRLANRSVLAKTALDTDCEASYFRVDDHRWYGISNTLHIQEVEHFGSPEQRTLPENTGTGLIWRLSSITRLEERDGGVYAATLAYSTVSWFVLEKRLLQPKIGGILEVIAIPHPQTKLALPHDHLPRRDRYGQSVKRWKVCSGREAIRTVHDPRAKWNVL